MRNALIAHDLAANVAGNEILANGGNATDAVLSAILAGAARGGASALLGSAVFLLAGAGVGAWMVDGRARAPGLDAQRRALPERAPHAWTAVVPGLFDAWVATHARFGSSAMGTLCRAAIASIREHATENDDSKQRISVLEEFARHSTGVLGRLGVVEATLQKLGPAGDGIFTRTDLVPVTPAPVPLHCVTLETIDVLLPAIDAPVRHPAPNPPPVAIDAAVAVDMHGTVACALWALPKEAMLLPGTPGLALAAMNSAPAKGVTRRKAGSTVPMPIPGAILRSSGRAYAGLAFAGEGDLVAARDLYLRDRLRLLGLEFETEASVQAIQGVRLWAEHAGDDASAMLARVRA